MAIMDTLVVAADDVAAAGSIVTRDLPTGILLQYSTQRSTLSTVRPTRGQSGGVAMSGQEMSVAQPDPEGLPT